jgi:hypothetical protein
MALNSGYSPYVATSVVAHIEKTEGFHNAMAKLAHQSNNLAIAVMHELQVRGFDTYTNKEMIQAITAISNAWVKFTAPVRESSRPRTKNKLRDVILNQVENQVFVVKEKKEEKLDLDF